MLDEESKINLEPNSHGDLDAVQSFDKTNLIYKLPSFNRPLTSYGAANRNNKRPHSQTHGSAVSRSGHLNTQSTSNLGVTTAGGKSRNSRQNVKNRLFLSNFEMYKQGFSASDHQTRPKTSLRNKSREINLIE